MTDPEREDAFDTLLGQRRLAVGGASENGLLKLALTLVAIVHELLEAQALRRADEGTLEGEDLTRVADVLLEQARQIERLCRDAGLSPEDLDLGLLINTV